MNVWQKKNANVCEFLRMFGFELQSISGDGFRSNNILDSFQKGKFCRAFVRQCSTFVQNKVSDTCRTISNISKMFAENLVQDFKLHF